MKHLRLPGPRWLRTNTKLKVPRFFDYIYKLPQSKWWQMMPCFTKWRGQMGKERNQREGHKWLFAGILRWIMLAEILFWNWPACTSMAGPLYLQAGLHPALFVCLLLSNCTLFFMKHSYLSCSAQSEKREESFVIQWNYYLWGQYCFISWRWINFCVKTPQTFLP